MEGKLNRLWTSALVLLLTAAMSAPCSAAQESAKETDDAGSAEISLRKTIGARQYMSKSMLC
jgi:hypothetical protein